MKEEIRSFKLYSYFYSVNPKKEILSYFLLATYLFVVAHQSIAHNHTSDADSNATHQHNKYSDIHHEHHFHVGIFHFLGHLFENISHVSNTADDYLVIIQNTSTKKVTDHKTPISTFYNLSKLVMLEVDAESLPAPPYYQISYLQKLTRSSLSLRAPPFHV